MLELEGNIVDIRNERIYGGKIVIEGEFIKYIEETGKDYETYLAPGFIDAHIHIESSMLCPSRFAEAVVPHGTTAVVTDPHEIANVMGIPGIDYMIKEASKVPLKVYFTAPSCVPATPFETAGGVIGAEDIEQLLGRPEIVALGEMMNFPGVVNEDPEVTAKLNAAKKIKKPIDGHAPMLSGSDLTKYVMAGISTEHECTTLEEAREKAKLGMRIMIREGSATKNLQELAPLASEFNNCFFVSDDKHPEDLREGHVNAILKKAVEFEIDPIKAIKMVSQNPVEHYNLDCGTLEEGGKADIVEFNNLDDFNVSRVFIDGKQTAEEGLYKFDFIPLKTPSTISISNRKPADFKISAPEGAAEELRVRIIEIVPDNIITKEYIATVKREDGEIKADADADILKLTVVNRYNDTSPATALIKGFGIKNGAVASSVAHDSHNIIAVGTDDNSIAAAVNTVISNEGGFAVIDNSGEDSWSLQLPIAGLMSPESADTVALQLKNLQLKAQKVGCALTSSFLTLSFMSLLVIPELKLSDKGLFDGRTFEFVDLIIASNNNRE